MQSSAIIDRQIEEFQRNRKTGSPGENPQPALAIYQVGKEIARHLEEISANLVEIKDQLARTDKS